MIEHKLLVPAPGIFEDDHSFFLQGFGHVRLDICQVNLAGRQGNEGFSRLDVDKTIRLWPALVIVIKRFVEVVSLGLVEIFEFIGAATNKCPGIVIFFRVSNILPDVPGKNGHDAAHIGHKGGVGLGQLDYHPVRTLSLSPSYVPQGYPLVGMLLKVVHSERHIFGSERLPVVPFDPVLKLEGKGQGLGIVGPFLGQSRDIAFVIFPDKGVKDPAHADIARSPGIMAIGIGIAPVTLTVCDAHLLNPGLSQLANRNHKANHKKQDRPAYK